MYKEMDSPENHSREEKICKIADVIYDAEKSYVGYGGISAKLKYIAERVLDFMEKNNDCEV